MSPAYHIVSKPLPGFQQTHKRPAKFKCLLCHEGSGNKFIMDRCAMNYHAEEPDHQLRLKTKEEREWAEWNMSARAWDDVAAKRWEDPDLEMQKWQPTEEEREGEVEAEQEKREWILEWIRAVQAAILQEKAA